MHSQEGGKGNFEFGMTSPRKKGNSRDGSNDKDANKGNRFRPVDKQVQMSPKVLETWINETLADAEHLDIPGVILKPEHKNPISRYGIDRMAFN